MTTAPRTPSQRIDAGRLIVGSAVLVLILAIAWVLLGSGGGYRVTAELLSSSQLVRGNQVRVGGVPIGSVDKVELGEDNLARVVMDIDESHAPLREGTTIVIRSQSAASIAARSVNLRLGPKSAKKIPDGGSIPVQSTTSIVETDEFFDTLDLTTTRRARKVLAAFRDALDGRGKTLNDGFRYLQPAASRSQLLFAEVVRDEPSLKNLVKGGADVVSTLADRSDSLTGGTESALQVADALADEREALSRSIARFPVLLRKTNTTLVNLRSTLTAVRPAIGEARPVARSLARLLPDLQPAASDLRRTIPALRSLIRSPGASNDVLDLLRDLPALDRSGTPVVTDLVPALDELLPVLDELRPYVPDVAAATTGGAFGGSSFGYYDGNGHYARVQFNGGAFSLTGLPALGQPDEALGNRRGLVKNCPGAASDRADDGSSPFRDRSQTPCDESIQAGSR